MTKEKQPTQMTTGEIVGQQALARRVCETFNERRRCTYPACECAISFPEGYLPSDATECPKGA